ncbi:phosphate signaling complex protein PhoU [Candidatus Desantisbacteria bacterium]|nr:phosphate signaling complex protein PhoU [Candidatus Desantisbacteria bacterium]
MERYFDEELKDLKDKILYMGNRVEIMVQDSLTGFKERQNNILQKVFEHEKEVNRLHIEIDDLCLKLMALRQPMAADLRFITGVMKINNNLERMGDQAVNISQNTLELIKHPEYETLLNLDNMSDIVKKMVRGSLDAFVKKDTVLAQEILLKDDTVDNLKAKIFQELLTKLKNAPSIEVNHIFELILISRNLERIADHATNICEDVIFMVLGKDIRHHHTEIDEKPIN